MNPNTAMETVGAGAKAATKLGEIIEKVFGPRWTRKQADADAYADQKKLQTIRENPDMEIVYVDGKLSARQCTPEALAFRAKQRMLTEAIQQEANIEKVFEVTAKELPSAETVSDKPVDDDWITRFFNIVRDVNTEEMQCVWGKILAGEIQKPGSFSMRTLDVLRNVSTAEANVFQKVCNCAMWFGNDVIIPTDLCLLKTKDVFYTDLIALSEAGLLILKELTTGTDFPPNVTLHMQLCSKAHLIHITGKNEKATRINCGLYKLTKAGAELYKVIETIPDEKYMIELAKKIALQNRQKSSVFVHKIISCENGNIRYESAHLFKQEQQF